MNPNDTNAPWRTHRPKAHLGEIFVNLLTGYDFKDVTSKTSPAAVFDHELNKHIKVRVSCEDPQEDFHGIIRVLIQYDYRPKQKGNYGSIVIHESTQPIEALDVVRSVYEAHHK
jgi:hypothetical protein